MKFFDTFTGIGGFSLGIKNVIPDAECIGFSEIDKYAMDIYEKHFPNHINFGDIIRLETNNIPDFDFLVGGFPCQSFSIAGRRLGFEDTRGTLFFELARILKDKRPRYFLFENVRGLLNHDSGKTFQTILRILTELGYDYQWQILNSKDFGVPQNRERVFVVGHLRGNSQPKVFPIEYDNNEDVEIQRKEEGERTWVPCLTTRYGQRWSDEGYIKRGLDVMGFVGKDKQATRVYNIEGVATTLCANGGGWGAKTGLYQVPSANKRGYEIAEEGDSIRLAHIGSKTGRGRVGKQRSQTLVTGGDMYTVQNSNIRRLTPLECERLQGFPDNWTQCGKDGKLISDNQRYKCLGNAVTVNVIEEIIKRMIDVLDLNQKKIGDF